MNETHTPKYSRAQKIRRSLLSLIPGFLAAFVFEIWYVRYILFSNRPAIQKQFIDDIGFDLCLLLAPIITSIYLERKAKRNTLR